jgi:TATA-box binding protein (TBP) (component of TFIID and TFIIIB)
MFEKQRLEFAKEIANLPKEIFISVVVFAFKFCDVEFYAPNIARFTKLNINEIISVKYGRNVNKLTNRSLMKKRKKTKKEKKAFYNQITIQIRNPVSKLPLKNPINIKIFKNGSLQVCGCKSIDELKTICELIVQKFKVVYGIANFEKGIMIDVPYVSNPTKLSLENVQNLQVCMINSNFNIDFKIDRQKLYDVLQNSIKNIKVTLDPMRHAPVNMKYEIFGKKISIFVFESGKIIITGSRKIEHLRLTYNFINKFLLENYAKVAKIDETMNILDMLENEENEEYEEGEEEENYNDDDIYLCNEICD